MGTAALNITLPDELRAFAEARAQARGFGGASDHARDLVRRDELRAEMQVHVDAARAKENRRRSA